MILKSNLRVNFHSQTGGPGAVYLATIDQFAAYKSQERRYTSLINMKQILSVTKYLWLFNKWILVETTEYQLKLLISSGDISKFNDNSPSTDNKNNGQKSCHGENISYGKYFTTLSIR